MKKEYKSPSLDFVEVFELSPILAGSVTGKAIKVGEVEVEDYHAGFDIGEDHLDFQDISFD